VKFERFSNGAATLSIADTKNDKIQTVLMNVGGEPASNEIKLVFDTLEGQRYLTKVRTPSRSYAVIMSKPEKSRGEKGAGH